ncbi:MAG: type II toxin-antitoxin system HicB family antitoxin [Candidatus Caenarcaniphilales bacterium]|nr:type II toxin-antitoxin system HicB family antitoxin [Candidatus Caenarcaniphilales bacterium]
MKIVALVHKLEEGGYWAEVPALPGCIAKGDNLEDLDLSLVEAIEGWFAVANERETEREYSHKLVLSL